MSQLENIIDKADDLFLRYGIKSVSMDDIAREMGISKKTLYTYTKAKSQLVEHVIHRHIEMDKNCIDEFKASSKDAVHEIFFISQYVVKIIKKISPKTIYELKKYHKGLYNTWEQFQKTHIYNVIRKNMDWGIEKDLYRKDSNVDIISRFYVSRSVVILDDEYFDPNIFRLSDVFLEHIKYHFHGVATSKGLRLYKKYLKDFPESNLT